MSSVQRTLFCAFCDEPADRDCALCRQSLCKGHAEVIDDRVAQVIDSQIIGFIPEKTIEQYACPSCLNSFDFAEGPRPGEVSPGPLEPTETIWGRKVVEVDIPLKGTVSFQQCSSGCHGPRCSNPALPGLDVCSDCQ